MTLLARHAHILKGTCCWRPIPIIARTRTRSFIYWFSIKDCCSAIRQFRPHWLGVCRKAAHLFAWTSLRDLPRKTSRHPRVLRITLYVLPCLAVRRSSIPAPFSSTRRRPPTMSDPHVYTVG